MKLQASIKSYFLTEEERSSQAQLLADFGVFPPTPLSAQITSEPFKVVRVRSLGCFYSDAQVIRRAWNTPESEFSSSGQSSELREVYEGIRAARAAFMDLDEKLKHIPGMRILLAILIGLTGLAVWIKSGRHKTSNLGYFTALPGSDAQVIIRSSSKKGGISAEAALTHEHIHLLQYRNKTRNSKEIKGLGTFIHAKWANNPLAAYLLLSVEVEARLHEVILSSYRASGTLPSTVDEFLAVLCGCSATGWITQAALEENNVDFSTPFRSFTPRDIEVVSQLGRAMLMIEDGPPRYRFLTEVLTVMYGNLLKYYGDQQAHGKFVRLIARPNLYDEMYGEMDSA